LWAGCGGAPDPISGPIENPDLPAFTIVGLTDRAIQEARERVKPAIRNADFDVRRQRLRAQRRHRAVLWSYTTGSYVSSSPAVANGVAYVGSGDGKVYAFSLGVALGPNRPAGRPRPYHASWEGGSVHRCMDSPIAARRATPADIELVTTIIELAFANDPLGPEVSGGSNQDPLLATHNRLW
jgi:PQQ-like domain/Subunit ChlI of Mg-chelatase